MTKTKFKKQWTYDERDLREDVKDNLPNDWKLRVFKVTSGDSGKEYWVQVLWQDPGGRGWACTETIPIVLCDCPEGKFLAPLVVLGLNSFICKHGKNLLDFLKARK